MWYIPYVPIFIGESMAMVIGILCILFIVGAVVTAMISDIILTLDEERDRI